MLQHPSTANSLTPSKPSNGIAQRKQPKVSGKVPYLLSNPTGSDSSSSDDDDNFFDDLSITWADDYFDKDGDKILVVFDFANTSENPFWNNNGEPWLSFLLIYIETTLYTIFFLNYYSTSGTTRVLFWIVTAIFVAIFGYILKRGYQVATTCTSRHTALTMNGGFRYVEVTNNMVADYTVPLILIQDIRIPSPAANMFGNKGGDGRATLYFKEPVIFNAGPFQGVPLKEFKIQSLKDPMLFKQIVLYVKEVLEKSLAKEKQKES